MSAVLFLARRQIRNIILDVFRHPSKLILYLVTIAALAAMLVGSLKDPPRASGFTDVRVLEGGYLALLLFSVVSTLLSGLKSGSSVFRMPDVNFLFVSPLSSKRILIYGIVKQMLSLLFSLFFLIFYIATLTKNFGISGWEAAVLIVSFVLLLFLSQVLSLLVYSYANGSPVRRSAVRAVVWSLPVAAVLIAGAVILKNGGGMEAALGAVSSPALEFLPLAGWMKGAVFAASEGVWAWFAVYASLLAATLVLSIVCYWKSNPDYYEDVLQNAETVFELKQSVKERRTLTASRTENVKVRKTGIGGGWGANVFFYKHLCEAHRKNRFAVVRLSTLLLLAGNLILVFAMQAIGRSQNDPAPSYVIMAAGTALSIYFLFFMNAAGDWSRELMKPYIFLVPANPFQKLIWACMTTLAKPMIDGLIVFSAAALAAGANFPTGAICVLLYASFGFFFTASNILAQRVFGGMANKGVVLMLYMLLLILIAAPGIVGGVLLHMFVKSPAELAPFLFGLPVVCWNILVSLGIFYACRNLLGTAEMD